MSLLILQPDDEIDRRAHQRFTEKAYGSEKVVSTVGFLKKGAELELKHANLTKYSPTSA